ncbi:MAG TPA: FG-GAP-like repeat-containing protein [Myxococcota bacterium]|nr:FG-GAP-like repeat-containing protein [Myxococcota bacterium]
MRLLFVVLGLACHAPGDTTPPAADDGDTPVDDTPPPADDSDPPVDSPVETDDSDPIEPPPFDPPLAPPPPASWGDGFIDETRALPLLDVLPVDVGTWQPPRPPEPGFGVIGDVDEDGHPEMIVGNGRDEDTGGPRALRVYTWYGPGDLRRNPALETKIGPQEVRPWALLDLDDDGHLDLLTASLTPRVRWGAGDGSFPTETALRLDLPPDVRDPFLSGGAIVDLDGDGWLDLLLGVTGCYDTVVPWLRTGPRAFTERRDMVDETTGAARTSAILPTRTAGGEGLWVAITDTCDRSSPHPGFYQLSRPDPMAAPIATSSDVSPSDAYWRFDPATGGGPMTLVAPMGVATADWDLDGELDLALALGTRLFALLSGRPDGTWVDRSSTAHIQADPPTPGFPDEFPWGVGAPDLDLDGWPDLLLAMGDDATSLRLVRGQTMQPQVWRNQGGWSFADITAETRLGIDGGWHGLVLHDLDDDGDADVLLGGYGNAPRLLHNRIRTGNRGVAIRLRGTTSNRYGVGAIVRAEPDGLPPRTLLVGDTGNPEGQPVPTLFLGLGAATSLPRVTITWPSGLTQVVEGLASGHLHEIVEPEQLAVLDADRRAPAGSTVDLRVTPRAADGSVKLGCALDVRTTGGSLRSATLQDDGSWLVRLVGPDVPGTTTIEARVDGVPIEVRPRLWWE